MRRRTESIVTLLPQPLSPTTPSVSPGLRPKENSIHGMDETVGGFEGGFQPLDIE